MIKKLKNGLTLVLLPSEATAAVTLLVYANAGARFENRGEAGVSHFLEHLFFSGTKKRPNLKSIVKEIDSIGADFNAQTSEEVTSFFIKSASEHLEKTIDVLSDMLSNSKLSEGDIEREKKVIIEELKLHEDMPASLVNDIFSDTIYAGNSLSTRIGGVKETVKKITREKLVDYKDQLYSAERVFICISGNFGGHSSKKIAKIVEEKFKLPASNPQIKTSSKFSQKPLGFKIQDSNQTNIIAGFFAPAYNDKDKIAVKLLSIILGGNMSSRMFEEIREKRGLAYDVRTSFQALSDTGVIYTNAGIANENASKALKAILSEYERAKSDISQEELSAAKTFIIGQMKIAFEDSHKIAVLSLSQKLFSGKIKTLNQLFAEIMAVTIDDIKQAAKRYFKPKKLSVAFIGPKSVKKEIEQIVSINFKNYLS